MWLGVWAGRHVPAGSAAVRRGPGAGRVLHHPLCRHRGDRGHEGPGVQCPAPGGNYAVLSHLIKTLCLRSSPRTRWQSTCPPSCGTRWRMPPAPSPTWTTIAGPPSYLLPQLWGFWTSAITNIRGIVFQECVGNEKPWRYFIREGVNRPGDGVLSRWGHWPLGRPGGAGGGEGCPGTREPPESHGRRGGGRQVRPVPPTGGEELIIRNARAKVIAAEGEHKSSRALRHAAEVIMDSPAALQVSVWVPDSGVWSFVLAPIPPNFEQHCGRKQQHRHISRPYRCYFSNDGEGQ